jgi:hypothetical protein
MVLARMSPRGLPGTPSEDNSHCAQWISSVHTGYPVSTLRGFLQYCSTIVLQRSAAVLHYRALQYQYKFISIMQYNMYHLSAPWTRKMPSRSPCPKVTEARGRRPGADHRRAYGSRGYFGGRCCLTAGATTDHSPNASRLRHPDR